MKLAAALIAAVFITACVLALAGCSAARVIGNSIVNPSSAN